MRQGRDGLRARALCGLLATALGLPCAQCARLIQTASITAEPLESPRRAEIQLEPRLGVRGQRRDQVVVAEVYEEARCADELRQRVSGTRTTHTRADGHSLLAEWLLGGSVAGLGAAGLTWTATRAADPEEPAGAQTSRCGLLGGVTVVGAALLGAALWQHLQLGEHREDLGVRELRRVERERPCGRSPRAGEALRLTLSDGTQLEATSDSDGKATFALPDDLAERLEAGGARRAALEARSDPHAQAVVPL